MFSSWSWGKRHQTLGLVLVLLHFWLSNSLSLILVRLLIFQEVLFQNISLAYQWHIIMKYKLLLLPWTPDRPPGSNSNLYTSVLPRHLCNEPGYQIICPLNEILPLFAYIYIFWMHCSEWSSFAAQNWKNYQFYFLSPIRF